jgi:hypothetical protein
MKVLKIANKIIKSDDWIKNAQESQKKPNVSGNGSSHSQSVASSNTGNDNKSSKDEPEDEFEDGLL